MASQGPNSPSAIPSSTYTNSTDVYSSNNVYATRTFSASASIVDDSVKLKKPDTTLSSEKSTGAYWDYTDSYISWGGATDLWGLTWTPAEINSADFAFYNVAINLESGSADITVSAFGFTIPTGATINGILAEMERKVVMGGKPTYLPSCYIDHIRITVYYTEGGGSTSAIKSVNGLAKASIKSVDGLAIASVKSINGLA